MVQSGTCMDCIKVATEPLGTSATTTPPGQQRAQFSDFDIAAPTTEQPWVSRLSLNIYVFVQFGVVLIC